MQEQRNKWDTVVAVAWFLSVVSVISAIWMIYQYGFGEQIGLDVSNQLASQTKVNMPVIVGGVFQAAASVLFACLFSMLNSIYQNTVDIWAQNQNAMRRSKP